MVCCLAFPTKKGWWDEAIEDLKAACRFGDDAPAYLSALAEAYLRKGWFDEAVQCYSWALEKDWKRPIDHFMRGVAYHRKGWFNEAA